MFPGEPDIEAELMPGPAPSWPACMMPGPAPVMTMYPAAASRSPVSTARRYSSRSGVVRAEPKIETLRRPRYWSKTRNE